MTIASANTRVRWAGIGVGPLVEIVVASIALVTGICPAAAAKSAEGQSTYAVIPAQLSMGEHSGSKEKDDCPRQAGGGVDAARARAASRSDESTDSGRAQTTGKSRQAPDPGAAQATSRGCKAAIGEKGNSLTTHKACEVDGVTGGASRPCPCSCRRARESACHRRGGRGEDQRAAVCCGSTAYGQLPPRSPRTPALAHPFAQRRPLLTSQLC
jgi:hypothetical protein